MEIDSFRTIYQKLIDLADKQGYVTFDNISDLAQVYSLSPEDVYRIRDMLLALGVLIYVKGSDKATHQVNVHDGFARTDYEIIYKQIVEYSPSLKSFVDYIKKIVPPQRGEVKLLKDKMFEGDINARQRMIEMYLRHALKIALHRAVTYGLDIEETVGDACIGLINAVDKYNPDTSKPFAPYAALHIAGEIIREQSNQRPSVYYPDFIRAGYFKMYPILKKYGCIGCSDLNDCEKATKKVLDKLKCDEQRAKLVIRQMVPDIRYEVLVERFEEKYDRSCDIGPLFAKLSKDTIIDEEDAFQSVHDNYRRVVIEQQLETILPQEAFVIKEYFGLNGKEKTLQEIGKTFDRSGGRARQLRDRGIRRMRHPKRATRLKVFWQ